MLVQDLAILIQLYKLHHFFTYIKLPKWFSVTPNREVTPVFQEKLLRNLQQTCSGPRSYRKKCKITPFQKMGVVLDGQMINEHISQKCIFKALYHCPTSIHTFLKRLKGKSKIQENVAMVIRLFK